ncbi:MAG: thioredoxin [Methermicoccaceae archaeon]
MDDNEIEMIKKQKMEELMKKTQPSEGPVIDEPITLTDATLPEAIAKHKVLVVDCWAEWCGPCRMVAPVISALAKQYAGRVVFGKIDADKNPQTMRTYGISAIPSMLFFKDGQYLGKKVGALPQPMLAEVVDSVLQG